MVTYRFSLQHLVHFYGTNDFGVVKFSDVRPFSEFYDDFSSPTGKFRALGAKRKMEREKGIVEAKRDAGLKNKWARAASVFKKKK